MDIKIENQRTNERNPWVKQIILMRCWLK